MLKPNNQPFVDCVFSQAVEASRTDLPSLELRLKAAKVEDVWNSYGIELEAESANARPRNEACPDGRAAQGAELMSGSALLTVREEMLGRITTVGIQAMPASRS